MSNESMQEEACTTTPPPTLTMSLDRAIVKGLSIQPTPLEHQLFETLKATAVAYENGDIDYDPLPKDGSSSPLPSPSFDKTKNKNKTDRAVEIRIAGGWVRDKLLGLRSDDVDIAVDTMSGYQFAVLVQRYLQQQQQLPTSNTASNHNHHSNHDQRIESSSPPPPPPRISVIAANPSQSKHLETATMNIRSFECDLVKLRGGETYTSTSRIPTLQQHATPLDDALRRDFTINALFWNVRNGCLEDWTGRGVHDLTAEPLVERRLVTPMDASETFRDDPLRVLRAVRFGVRFGIVLHGDIVKAAGTRVVQDSLMVKVSRERVGKELEGMLVGKGADPAVALRNVVELGLADCVFCVPDSHPSIAIGGGGRGGGGVGGLIHGEEYRASDNSLVAQQQQQRQQRKQGWEESKRLVECAATLLPTFRKALLATQPAESSSPTKPSSNTKKQKSNPLSPSSSLSTLDERMLYLSTFLHPFRYLTYQNVKKKTLSVPSYIIQESLKFKNKDVQDIDLVLGHVDEMRRVLVERYLPNASSPSSPASLLTVNGNQNNVDSSLVVPTPTTPFCRLEVGLMLRNLKQLWVTTLLLAAVAEAIAREENTVSPPRQRPRPNDSDYDGTGTTTTTTTATESCLNAAIRFYQDIHNQNLDCCWRTRPLLDGRALIQTLGLPRGPLVGTYMQEQVRWMLLHPEEHNDGGDGGGDGRRVEDLKVYLKCLREKKLVAGEEKG